MSNNINQVLKSFRNAQRLSKINLEKNMNTAGLYVEGESKKETPISKGVKGTTGGTLQSSITAQRPKKIGSKIVVIIGTNVFYAIYVHEGQKGKKFNYHKGYRVYKYSEGAKFFTDVLIREKTEIIKIIRGKGI